MKPSSKRTLKKAFLNITAGLCAIVFTGNVIAGECAGQINSALGTATSKVVSTLAEGETEGYARYFESKYNSIAELKAAGEAKVREVEGEGIVLLKNDNNILPLKEGSDVALVGVTILDPVYGGTTGAGAVGSGTETSVVGAAVVTVGATDDDVAAVVDGATLPTVVDTSFGEESHVGSAAGVHNEIANKPPRTTTTAAADTAIRQRTAERGIAVAVDSARRRRSVCSASTLVDSPTWACRLSAASLAS